MLMFSASIPAKDAKTTSSVPPKAKMKRYHPKQAVTNYQQDVDAEMAWYKRNPHLRDHHFLTKWPFAHITRHKLAYKYFRNRARISIKQYIGSLQDSGSASCLVAPCGTNADQDILEGIANEYFAIDLVKPAKELPNIHIHEGDILKNPYKNNSFDIIASFLFFHHLHKVGFDKFLDEFSRIIRKNGILLIIEPSALFPVSWVMAVGKKIFGNISGLVPDEAPLIPNRLNQALRRAGFRVEKFEALSF